MRSKLSVPAVLLVGSACSFLAPTDKELMGVGAGIEGSSGASGTGEASAGKPSGEAAAAGSRAQAGGTGGVAPEPAAGAGSADDEEPGAVGGNGGSAGTNGGAAAAGTGGGVNPGDPNSSTIHPVGPFDGPAATSSAGLLFWFKADSGITQEAGAVVSWKDSSKHAHLATAAADARPAVAMGNASGLPTVAFDGSDDYLALPSGFADFAQGLTFFAAVQEGIAPACPSVLQLSSKSEVADIDFGLDSDRVQAACAGAGCGRVPTNSSGEMGRMLHYEVAERHESGPLGVFGTGINIIGVVHRPDKTVALRTNRVSRAYSDLELPAVQQRTSNFIGKTLYASCQLFRGHIGELLLYNRALSDAERDKVEAYLVDRWQ